MHQVLEHPENVLDPTYFISNLSNEIPFDNWVYDEMWEYFRKSHPTLNADDVHRHLRKSRIQVLEVYCSEQSQLTHQGSQLGLVTARFGLRQGDLSTFKGRCALYEMIWTLRPQHIWVFPKMRTVELLESFECTEILEACRTNSVGPNCRECAFARV